MQVKDRVEKLIDELRIVCSNKDELMLYIIEHRLEDLIKFLEKGEK